MSSLESILGLFVGILTIWLIGISFFLVRTYRNYRQLTQNIEEKDFLHILKELKDSDKKLHLDLKDTLKSLEDLSESIKPHLQQIGFVRYNPFGNTGGDQSFCLCLLDGRGNGILITSLHARQQTRLYTKEIINNQPIEGAELSKEEKLCLQSAQKWRKL